MDAVRLARKTSSGRERLLRGAVSQKKRKKEALSRSLIGYLYMQNGRRTSNILITDTTTLQGFLSHTRVHCRIIITLVPNESILARARQLFHLREELYVVRDAMRDLALRIYREKGSLVVPLRYSEPAIKFCDAIKMRSRMLACEF